MSIISQLKKWIPSFQLYMIQRNQKYQELAHTTSSFKIFPWNHFEKINCVLHFKITD